MTSYHADQLIKTSKNIHITKPNSLKLVGENWWLSVFHIHQQQYQNMSDHVFCFTLFLLHICISCWQPFQCLKGFFNDYRRWVYNLLIFFWFLLWYILTFNNNKKIMMKTIAKCKRNFMTAFKIMWSNNILQKCNQTQSCSGIWTFIQCKLCYIPYLMNYFCSLYFYIIDTLKFYLSKVMLLQTKLMRVWDVSNYSKMHVVYFFDLKQM